MEYFALLIPILSIPLMRVYFPHRVVWWELFLPVIPFFVITPIVKYTAETAQVRDHERWGGWVTEVRYYEDWDEWITQTCTQSVPCGTDKDGRTQYCTETYDCSYRDYHPEYWEAHTNNGEIINISQGRYQVIKSRFGNSSFVDMHRDYDTNDGDMYKSKWEHTDRTLTPLFTEHSYENRVQVNKGVWEYPKISDKEGLYEFPSLSDNFDDPAILGNHKQKDLADYKLQRYNAKYGSRYQIRYWIVLFKNQPRSKGFDQESLWKGGNKNEFVTCIGFDDNNKPMWCHPFCWSPEGYSGNDTMRIEIRDFVEQQKNLDLVNTVEFIVDRTKKHWKRKPFAEFSYLTVEMPTWAIVMIYVITAFSTFGVCVYIIKNEISEPAHLHNNSGFEEFYEQIKNRTNELQLKFMKHLKNLKNAINKKQ